MGLTTLDKFRAWDNSGIDSSRDDEIDAAILRASAWVERVSFRPLEEQTHIELFNGRETRGHGTIIQLDPTRFPVLHVPGTEEIVVEENGLAVALGVGYEPTKDAFVIDANVERPCQIRRTGTWANPGTEVENIKVTYIAGYDTGTTPAAGHIALPLDIEWLANELTVLEFKSPGWIGKQNVNRAGQATSFNNALTPPATMTLERLIAQVVL